MPFCGSARRSTFALVVTLAALLCVAAIAAGCTAAPSKPAQSPTATQPSAEATPAGTTAQLCGECGGLGMPPKVVGTATDESGVQVLNVGIVDGFYAPNDFTVKAGQPVKVVFTGSAKGCVAKPKFAELGKQVDITSSGSGAIDLGTLEAGTYNFTCGMGMNKGTITVQ